MDAVAALRAGQPVVLPTDTVYGLCADASSEVGVPPCARSQGTAGGAAGGAPLRRRRGAARARPGAAGGARSGAAAWAVHARLRESRAPLCLACGGDDRRPRAAAACSCGRGRERSSAPSWRRAPTCTAGATRGRSTKCPRRFVPAAARSWTGASFRGVPSTVLDLTGAEPRVLREGVVPAAEALSRLAAL